MSNNAILSINLATTRKVWNFTKAVKGYLAQNITTIAP